MEFDRSRPRPRWGIPDILIGLIAFLGGAIALTIPAVALTREVGWLNIASLIGSWIGMVGWLWFISRRKGQGSFKLDFGFRFKLYDPVLGIATGFVTLIIAGIVSQIVAQLFTTTPGENSSRIFADQSSAFVVIATAVLAAVGAPIVEELFFRGLTQRAIDRRLGTIPGVILSALLFGLLHWQAADHIGQTISLVSAIVVYGVMFAIVDRWQHRLGPSIFAHMTINTIAASVTLYDYYHRLVP
jgi:membrane protease YdiL (CAAX protease family)